MSYFLTALQTEGLKIYKSKVIWITIAAFTIAPLMAGFLHIHATSLHSPISPFVSNVSLHGQSSFRQMPR